MVYCAAKGCTSRSDTSKHISGITFHKFPKNEKLRSLWVKALQRENWVPHSSSRLCSLHFPEHMIDRTSVSVIRLYENAVPTVIEPFPICFQKVIRNNELPIDEAIPNSFTCTEPTVMPIESIGPKADMVVEPLQSGDIEASVPASTSETCLKLLGPEVKAPSLWLLVPTEEASVNEALEESAEKSMLQKKLMVENNKTHVDCTIPSSSTYMVCIGDESAIKHSEEFLEKVLLKRKLADSEAKNKKYVKKIKELKQTLCQQKMKIERLQSLIENLKCQEKIDEEILDIPGTIAGVIYKCYGNDL